MSRVDIRQDLFRRPSPDSVLLSGLAGFRLEACRLNRLRNHLCVVIFDEAHHVAAKVFLEIWNEIANNNDVNIQASLYSEMEGIIAENYDTRPVSGAINLFGGIIQKKRQDVSTFDEDTGTILSGFNKIFKYDERTLVSFPRNFPSTGSYEIISWQK